MIPSGVHLGSLQITRLVITRLIVWMLLLGSRGEGAFAPTPCRSRPFPPTPQRICCWRVKENQPIRWPDLKRRYLGGVTGGHRATWGSSPRGSRHSTRATSLRRRVQPRARCRYEARARKPRVIAPVQPVHAEDSERGSYVRRETRQSGGGAKGGRWRSQSGAAALDASDAVRGPRLRPSAGLHWLAGSAFVH